MRRRRLRTAASDPVAAALARFPDIEAIRTAVGPGAFAVGGFVRDALIGREPADLDLAIPGDPHEVGEAIARATGGSIFPLAEERGVWRITLAGARYVDIGTYGASIDADLERRDFTIDSIAAPLARPSGVLDPFDGCRDIELRLVRMTRGDAFRQDGARLLRGIRLAAELGFGLERSTLRQMRAEAAVLDGVAWERRRDELMRILATNRAAGALARMDSLRLLSRVLPELDAGRDCTQPVEHTWNVLRHQFETVRVVDTLFAAERELDAIRVTRREAARRAVFWQHEEADTVRREVEAAGLPLFKLACLVHDAGKPATKAEVDGRTRFFGHPQLGADLAGAAMRRLHFANREVAAVGRLVRDHLRPGQLAQPGEPPTRKALARFFRDLGRLAVPLLVLQFADAEATLGPRSRRANQRRHVKFISAMVRVRSELGFSVEAPARLVTGADIMELLRLQPGPDLGRILREIEDATDAGDVTSRADALELAKRLHGGRP